jgi:wyosine [tRNA(Phe)-imidazoG37] synthetase (radical SAM superfamily)
LGQSLGIDPIPSKTCNYNCVYCQLGRTRWLASDRKDFYPPESILAEVEAALASHEPGRIDCITFVGQGEPLLCRSLGRLIRGVKVLSELPVAVITNGSLLWQPGVREELEAADVVMPSLDCADETTFRRINRPSPLLRIGEVISGLEAFRQQYRGRLWVEVMLVRGVNDGESALLGLRDALAFLRPDRVQLNAPTRPPAESWVQPPDEEGLMRALAILGQAATVIAPHEGVFDLSTDLPLGEAIVEVIRRHPMKESELLRTLGDCPPRVVETALADLEADGRARRVEFRGQFFWRYVGGANGGEPR